MPQPELTRVPRRRSRTITILALATLLAAAATQKAPAQQDDTTRKISMAIENLGHEDHAVREAATRSLLAIGGPALAALRIATQSDDPEIAIRASEILQQLESGLGPEVDASSTALIKAYGNSTVQTKPGIPLNVKLLREVYQSWNDSKANSVAQWMNLLADQVEWHSIADGAPGMEFSRGCCSRDEVAHYFKEFGSEAMSGRAVVNP